MRKTVCIRQVDESLWKRFRAVAALKGLTVREALEQAIGQWLRLMVQGIVQH